MRSRAGINLYLHAHTHTNIHAHDARRDPRLARLEEASATWCRLGRRSVTMGSEEEGGLPTNQDPRNRIHYSQLRRSYLDPGESSAEKVGLRGWSPVEET